jgi:hypothetical protein
MISRFSRFTSCWARKAFAETASRRESKERHPVRLPSAFFTAPEYMQVSSSLA